jgi:heme/copper-type cytochrome/quinol oxidase subunit 2
MMYWNDGWAWFWMLPMMLVWVLVLGAVVYAAVRLANRDSHQHQDARL